MVIEMNKYIRIISTVALVIGAIIDAAILYFIFKFVPSELTWLTVGFIVLLCIAIYLYDTIKRRKNRHRRFERNRKEYFGKKY